MKNFLLLFLVLCTLNSCKNPLGQKDTNRSTFDNGHTAFPAEVALQMFSLSSALAGDTQVILSWETSKNAKSYEVYYGTSSGNATIQALVCSGIALTCTVTGLINNQQYFFIVKSSNDTESLESNNELSATPIPTPHIVYSVRKFNDLYTGASMRVRRSSDNTEQDISFVGNDLDTTSLLSFVGAGSGYVKTWYDQSGNSNHSTQTNSSLQPMIVNSGSVILKNTVPTLLFNSSSLQTTNSFSLSDWTIIVVISDNSGNTSYERVLDHSYIQGFWFGRNAAAGSFGGGVKETGPPYGRFVSLTSSQLTLIGHQRVSSTHSVWSNNNYAGRISGAVTSSATQNNPFAIGSWLNNSNPAQGATDMNISELIIYFSDQTLNLPTVESGVGSYFSIF